MNRRAIKRLATRSIPLVLLILAASWSLLPVTGLRIVDGDSSSTLLLLCFAPEEPFTIAFIHSIAKRPVEETLHVRNADGMIVLDTVVWDMNGAGLPYEAEPGMVFEVKDGKYVLSRMNREFAEILQAVGTVADHHLVCGERTLALERLVEPGEAIRLKSARLPKLVFWCARLRWLKLSEPL